MLRVKEVVISLIVIILVSIHSRRYIVKTRHKQYLVKLKERHHAKELNVPVPTLHDPNEYFPDKAVNYVKRGYGGNDYLDYVDYADYENGVQGGDYWEDIYVDEDWDHNNVDIFHCCF